MTEYSRWRTSYRWWRTSASGLSATSGCSTPPSTARASASSAGTHTPVDDKAAVLLESLVRNHALVDGNKRLGWLSVVVLFSLDNVNLGAPEDDAYDLAIGVANGTANYHEVATRLATWH